MGLDQPAGLSTLPGRSSYDYSEDTSFVSGEDATVIDVYAALSNRLATQGWFTVDGTGDIQIEISSDGTTYGDAITLKGKLNSATGIGETLPLNGLAVAKLRVQHTGTDSAYRRLNY